MRTPAPLLSLILSVAAIIATPTLALAQTVYDIESRDLCATPPAVAGLPLDLEPGLYSTIAVEGVYIAYNRWGISVTGCGSDGFGCFNGFVTQHEVQTADATVVSRPHAPRTVARTAELSIMRPYRTVFRKRAGEPLTIGIVDNPCGDNNGGVSVLVEPLDCPDLDLDGVLTIFDFLAFQNAFDQGQSLADFDGDGALTIFDFLAFQNAFDAGCP